MASFRLFALSAVAACAVAVGSTAVAAAHTVDVPRGQVPSELIGEIKDCEVEAPVFDMGRTRVNFHLNALSEAIPTSLTVFVNKISGAQDEYTVKIDAEGNGKLEFDQYGA
ncbi:MAG: hypothetical protein K2K72_02120, partial [Duncaniella sp.]|nr:hypothetical protein [Duncaniella sp.]